MKWALNVNAQVCYNKLFINTLKISVVFVSIFQKLLNTSIVLLLVLYFKRSIGKRSIRVISSLHKL